MKFIVFTLLAMIIGGPVLAAPEADRKAILAMAGAYRVNFNFEETIALAPGYKMHSPDNSVAREWVEVVEDTGDRIVLQHLLLTGGDKGVKHWRQEWIYENRRLMEFKGRNRWEARELSAAEAKGTWSQAVYQVDDSPRYHGFGKWVHEAENVYWESNVTWRPLPRREHTTRSDYHALAARNRHTLTPGGWVHEQDNTKLVLDENGKVIKALAREVGLNTYDRTDAAKLALARDYWKQTGAFWKDVRDTWAMVSAKRQVLALKDKVDGKTSQEAMFEYAKKVRTDGYRSDEEKSRIAKAIAAFVSDD